MVIVLKILFEYNFTHVIVTNKLIFKHLSLVFSR